MADLKSLLSSFGMLMYHDRLVEAGFDSWETILDITENDLEILNVQRGHRRRLQQEIARTLRFGDDPNHQRLKALSRSTGSTTSTLPHAKRHYYRRPKPDPSAPGRPLSAYVLFSNAVREELKEQNMSFSETSRVAGDRWQSLPQEIKEKWKQKASSDWEKYKADREEYQGTKSHHDYQAYLEDFNASQQSRKRKVLSDDPSDHVVVSQPKSDMHHASSSASHRSAALKRLAPAPGYPPLGMVTGSTPVSTSDPHGASTSKARQSTSSSRPRQDTGSQRFSHACDSCKRKKLGCNGALPKCGVRDKDKRLAENLSDTLSVWQDTLRRIRPRLNDDDQSEVTKLLLMDPRNEKAIKTSSNETSPSAIDCSSEDAGSDSGGESLASDVGSMGSVDHLDEESFASTTSDGRINAFLGQTATDNWVDRLDKKLTITETDENTGLDHLSANHNIRSPRHSGNLANIDRGRLDAPNSTANIFTENLDPYALPPKATADLFVSVYFTTVHPALPILSRAEFLRNYEQYYTLGNLSRSSPTLVIIHLVLAMGAIHTYTTQPSAIVDEDHRLLSFAKAQATILKSSVFQASAYEQTQLCGLGGLYLLAMYEINQ
ncbi:MAG: hypothetical protein Q9166_002478 [cf. Caloplaca sp. 2 TL-2023]